MKNLKSKRGITLIALVITIIVLLILAGVAISTLTGENGILKQTESAKSKTRKAEAKEKIQLEMAASFDKIGQYDVDEAIKNLEENLKLTVSSGDVTKNSDGTLKVKLNGYEFDVDKKGNVKDHIEINIEDYVKVGQYVDYEPTKTDVNKTQAVESNKLTYSSPKGTIPKSATGKITHGNGHNLQIFKAKANDETENGLKWRVLSVSKDRIELISENLVNNELGSKFVLYGGISYLYAEQELNEICKIYGYGYGADTSVGTTYTIGGPEDSEFQEVKTITGTGARSITLEDLNKKAGIYKDEEDGKMKYNDKTVIDADYGTPIEMSELYYPTLYSNETTFPGKSESKKSGFIKSGYQWSKSKITNTNIQDLLFNGEYYLSSRNIGTNTSVKAVTYNISYVNNDGVSKTTLCAGFSNDLRQMSENKFSVRPVVTLKSEVIDLNTDYETEGEWKLK